MIRQPLRCIVRRIRLWQSQVGPRLIHHEALGTGSCLAPSSLIMTWPP